VTAAMKLDVSPRIFAAMLLALAVVVSGGAWYTLVVPKHHKASTLQTSIEADQAKLAAAQHVSTTPTQDEGRQQSAVQAALPDALAMPQLVDQLNALADQAGVTLDTVTPAASETGAGYVDVPLTVVVDGRYFAVQKFLHLVRNQVSIAKSKVFASGRLFDVTGMQLDQTEPAPTVTATFQLKAYYFSPGATVPAPAPTDTTTTSGS
jgi:hypothetical protein